MIPIKSERDLRVMRRACAIAAKVLDDLCLMAKEGVWTWQLDQAGKQCMQKCGGRRAC